MSNYAADKGWRYCQFHRINIDQVLASWILAASRQIGSKKGEKYCWNLEQILWCSRNKIGCGLQQNWLRPYDSSSSAPTALMNELSTAHILSIHVPILKVYFLGGATRFEGSRSRQSQIRLCEGVSSPNWHPDTSQLGNPTIITLYFTQETMFLTPKRHFFCQKSSKQQQMLILRQNRVC